MNEHVSMEYGVWSVEISWVKLLSIDLILDSSQYIARVRSLLWRSSIVSFDTHQSKAKLLRPN
jgi:hypothetical protein